MTKKFILLIMAALAALNITAQNEQDSFRAYLYNNEYNVYLRINFYDQDIEVPGQPLYGQLPGYLGKKNNPFCWVIVSCKVENEKNAEMQLINDYGSEDLTATLTRQNDSIYVLKQKSGSNIKVPNKGKWMKLPNTFELKRSRK